MVDVASANLKIPAVLEGAGRAISGAGDTMSGELDSLKSVTGQLPVSWIGENFTNYWDYQTMWNTASDGLFNPETGLIGQIARVVDVNWNNYVDLTHANNKSWQA